MEPNLPELAQSASQPSPAMPAAAATPSREKMSLRRRALLGAAGIAGVAVLTRLAKGGELSPPAGPVTPTGTSLGAMSGKIDQAVSKLEGQINSMDSKIALTPQGISEPRTPVASLSASAEAQFVITEPGAYCLTTNLAQVPGMVCIDIQADHVDLDCQGFVFLGGGGGGGGGSSCIRASGRQAIEIYDGAFKGWQGRCCDLADCDDVYLSDLLFHECVSPADPATGNGAAMVLCRDRCGIEDCAVSHCAGGAFEMGHSGYLFEVTVTDSIGLSARCGDGCCVEMSHFIRNEGEVMVLGDRCAVSECDFRQTNGLAVSAGSACVIECCECTGGTGGGFHCGDGCCVEDCTVLNRDALAIECGSRCSVTENQVVLCWGIACDSECVCCDNELSSCGGAPDTPDGVSGAITVRGAYCTCEENFISSSRVGLSIQAGGSWSQVHSNVVTGAGDAVDGSGGGILVHDAAAGVLCTCNHATALGSSPPYQLGAASHGPIVVLAGGDLSDVPGSSHPLANTSS